MHRIFEILLLYFMCIRVDSCKISQTTASGTAVKTGAFCSGELIFEENFDELTFTRWKHERTFAGGDDWQFQWSVNNRSNSFVKDGKLYIRPTLTADVYGENFLSSGNVNLNGEFPGESCTNAAFYGCERAGNVNSYINPIRSAKLRSYNSFNFRYGKIDIRAKLPQGDWLRPYISFTPKDYVYGDWPASGGIVLVMARGNKNLLKNNVNIGSMQLTTSLSWGPYSSLTFAPTFTTSRGVDLTKSFHLYTMEWSPTGIVFKMDNQEIGSIPPPQSETSDQNFYESPWSGGSVMAPFDQEFNINIALAVGGMSFFPDDAIGPYEKPWSNTSPTAFKEFWEARDHWLPTWKLNQTTSAFVIDFIKVYAI